MSTWCYFTQMLLHVLIAVSCRTTDSCTTTTLLHYYYYCYYYYCTAVVGYPIRSPSDHTSLYQGATAFQPNMAPGILVMLSSQIVLGLI